MEESESISSASEPITNGNSATEFSTKEVWQQVLDHLQPESTRELLRQMGNLIEFDGTVARIGMKSQSWCNQAKEKYLTNIKAAFQATFKQEVQIALELARVFPAKSTSVKEAPVVDRASISVTSLPLVNHLVLK